MLISRKHKFIFIHVYKNAGTSIRRALHPFSYDPWQKVANVTLKTIGVNYLNPTPLGSHATAQEAKSYLGEAAFDSYFSFAFVRNPWDWHASLYTFMLKDTTHYQHDFVKQLSGFEKYLQWAFSQENFKRQSDFLMSTNNYILVDHVGRFENLEEDFQIICSKIGIEASLPKANVSQSSSYRELYTKKSMINLVSEVHKRDIEKFNYNF